MRKEVVVLGQIEGGDASRVERVAGVVISGLSHRGVLTYEMFLMFLVEGLTDGVANRGHAGCC